MVACCVACALEGLFPHAYLASCLRAAATMLQGAIFIIIAQTRYVPHAAWDISDGDQAPFQYSKVSSPFLLRAHAPRALPSRVGSTVKTHPRKGAPLRVLLVWWLVWPVQVMLTQTIVTIAACYLGLQVAAQALYQALVPAAGSSPQKGGTGNGHAAALEAW